MSLHNYQPDYRDWQRETCKTCEGTGQVKSDLWPSMFPHLQDSCRHCHGVGFGHRPVELFPVIGKPHPKGLE